MITEHCSTNGDRLSAMEQQLAKALHQLRMARSALEIMDLASEPFRQTVNRWDAVVGNLQCRIKCIKELQ